MNIPEPKPSVPTALLEYIKKVCAGLHGHQIKSIAAVVAAILAEQSGIQAQLAKGMGNQEAGCKRIWRLLHNPRLSPKLLAELVFEQVLGQLPEFGKIRLAFDWTIEGKQYLLVISLAQGGRAIPIFWRAYKEKVLQKRMKKYERLMLQRVLRRLLEVVEPSRVILTADRGFADVQTFRLLKQYRMAFVIRVKYSTLVELEGKWGSLKEIAPESGEQRRSVGPIGYCKSDPERLVLSVSRLKENTPAHERWYLVSNRKWSAGKMAREYSRRFGCEEGFRDVKWELGFAAARMRDIQAWSRMFGLMALGLLAVSSLGSKLLLGSKKVAAKLLRRVGSRRKGRWDVSLISAVLDLLKQDKVFYKYLNPCIKLELEHSIQNVS
jgi:hypothetical protein